MSRDRKNRENGNGKCAIVSIPRCDCVRQTMGVYTPRGPAHPLLSRARCIANPTRYREGSPAQRRRADITDAESGIAPAAVIVLSPLEPVKAAGDEMVVISGHAERHR